MKKIFYSAILPLIFFAFVNNAAAQLNPGEVVLNEIVMAAPGTDSQTGCEYVELRGIPNVGVGNYTYLDIEGDAEQNIGTINYKRSLEGVAVGENGLIVITGAGNCRSFDTQSTVIVDPGFQSNFSTRNNGTNTFAVFSGQTDFQPGQDADLDNDGIIDQLNLTLFDGIAVKDGNADANADVYHQTTALLPRRPSTPSGEAVNAATRVCGENIRNQTDAWYYGDLDAAANTVQYNPSVNTRSAAFPANGKLTPGAKDSGGHCRLAFQSFRYGQGEIYAIDTDGANQIRLTANNWEDWDAALSADGAKIVFASSRTKGKKNFDIYSMNADGTNQIQLTNAAAHEDSPAFSPNGGKIVFRRIVAGQSEIFIMNANGSNQTRLAAGSFPSFSPNGLKIVFSSLRDGSSEIYSMNVDGTDQIRLTDNRENNIYPSFSPDGQSIVFVRENAALGNSDIYSMNADGTNQIRLNADVYRDFRPVRLYGAGRIAFLSDRFNNFNSEIFIMRPGENQLINLNRCLKCGRGLFGKQIEWLDFHGFGSRSY